MIDKEIKMDLNENLEENLKRLNNKFKRYGLEFNPEGNIIKVIEHQKYLLNDNPKVKEFLEVDILLNSIIYIYGI